MFEKMCEHSNGWRPEDGVPDLAMMSDITAEGINVNLRTRYERDQIYTFSGSILIAVNPYKQLDIYDNQAIARYRNQKLDQTDPHVFALAEAMYMNLVMQDASELLSSDEQPTKSTTTIATSSENKSATQHKMCTKTKNPTDLPAHSSKNQACVISGESGAGKTETTKFILSYLCSVTPNKSTWMEHQILEANTILEAFGNAKTIRNDNSSRFGKFIQICFDSHYQINGCIIQDYLLEQSRITYQSVGERNYHVFYQLLSAGQTNQELRKRFHLMPANFYEYLNKTQCYNVDGVNDCAMFDSLRMAMSVLNMEQESCDGLFSVLSAILWLGNLQFQCDDNSQNEQCNLTENDHEIIKIVASLLGVHRDKLEPILLRRQINVRGSITEIPFKIHEARDNLNGMAKALYSRLFTWVVNFINASTNPGLENSCFLGVLDIFGFENFDINSFEQLCINYANEKLHKFFNHHMFAMEQELYQREGISFCDINYTDNTPCLELLERPPNCILRLLSEECRMPKGSDLTFIEKLHTEFSSHPFYIKGNDRRNWSSEFSVRHFAGSVTYNVKGFLKKNKDAQQIQLLDIIETSTNTLLRDLVNCNSGRQRISSSSETASRSSSFQQDSFDSTNNLENLKSQLQRKKSFCSSTLSSSCSTSSAKVRRESSFNFDSTQSRGTLTTSHSSSSSRPTVADTFRHQLTSLVELLNSVNPWYVRCIKPNLEKSATDYDDKQVLLQLKYLGMSDLIKIRREGYPIHLTKHQFVCRYRCLLLRHLRSNPGNSPIRLDEKSLENYCIRMINYFQLNPEDWKIGKTMVLLRTNVYQPMEEKRNRLFVEMATLIQSSWKGYEQRKIFLGERKAAIRIQEKFRAYRGRLLYLRKKRAVLTIQAYVRGMFAREIASALREIKRAEVEKAKKAAIEAKKREEEERKEEDRQREEEKRCEEEKRQEEEAALKQATSNQVPIVNVSVDPDVDNESLDLDDLKAEGADKEKSKHLLTSNTETSTPLSNVSPAVSSSASWVGQDLNSSDSRQVTARDVKEMDELVKVLERHGISLDAVEQNGDAVYADFQRLYDVLGKQMPPNCDTQSISPSVNEDDRCSFATVGTTCDGDSVSCSGQSQISSTVTDENTGNEERVASEQSNEHLTDSNRDATINQNHDRNALAIDDNYQSNSTESIASIVSSSSLQSNVMNQTPSGQNSDIQAAQVNAEIIVKQALENQTRTSTFTGNSIVVGGSKLIPNGRPLTSIEEEPNSTATSPSKTPNKRPSRPPSLFPPDEENSVKMDAQSSTCNETKKRRLERKILQVQQEQNLPQINPTTAGLPICKQNSDAQTYNRVGQQQQSQQEINENNTSAEDDPVYGEYKCNMIEFAESSFNDHFRENNTNGVLRTLTRRRKSVDTASTMFLSKGEMLSYNSSFLIPASHIRMHDPHNSKISCSMFKNLCKYMTGESSKSDTEIRIIQSIIRHGIEKSELRDEIYVQIIRQLTNNPNHEFCLRLWVLFGLVSAAFSPSKSFSRYLIIYLKSKPRKDPSITCHAQFCLDNLQTPRINPRRHPPSPLEIQACKSLTNLTCKIHLLDGRSETIGLHPCDTALDALTKLAQRIGLQSTEGWALYESYTSGSSKYPHPSYELKGDFERSVRAHHFMADLIACWQDEVNKSGNSISLRLAQKRLNEGNFKLTMKKRIFRGPKIRKDPLEISLLYAQAVYNVVKKDSFLVDEQLAVSLAGMQAQLTLGNAIDVGKIDCQTKRGKSTKPAKIAYKPPHQIYEVETYVCQRLRNQTNRSKKEWCMLIAQEHRQYHGINEIFCKMKYISQVVCHCPLYGTATFKVLYKDYQTLDQNLLLGVNCEGLVLIRLIDRVMVNGYKYIDIYNDVTVYVEEKILQFTVKDRSNENLKCLTFEASECEEIAMLMSSYTCSLNINVRGGSLSSLDPIFDQNALKKRPKLKMTLEDRMRIHQEVQNARKAIIKSGKLRKPIVEENSTKLLRHTLRRLASSKTKPDKSTRFESVYGTLGKVKTNKPVSDIPQTSSDYNIYGSTNATSGNDGDSNQPPIELAEVTANTTVDEITKAYPHRYWAYTKTPLKNSLLIIYDSDLEEAALLNFNAILTYSGLVNDPNSNSSTLDSSSIDSGIASQQSLTNMNGKVSSSSPSSTSSGDIYDVCPKKIDERELLRLAQGILDRCLRKDADILKNEFFLQLIKQTTDHPDPNCEINQRHWQLLALACSVTYPSDKKILFYLYAHLRRCSLDQVTNEGRFAQFTLKSLQGTLETKGRLCAPSEIEILSTIKCSRVYAKVYLMDGQFNLVEFDPCATIAEVVEQIKRKLGLRQDCVGYALFQPLDDDCEQVLQPEEKVGDAIASWESWQKQKMKNEQRNQQEQKQIIVSSNGTKPSSKESIASLSATPKSREHRFIFKKYLFLESLQDANDPVERELMFLQTVACIKEDKFPALGQEAATILCAIKSQIQVGDYTKLCNLPREHIRMFYKQVIMSLMPPHAFNNLPIPAIAQQHQAFRDLSCAEAKKYFFNLIQSFGRANLSSKPGYVLLHRAHIYEASPTSHSAWDHRVWIAVNQFGVHFLKIRSRDVLGSCNYEDISEYNSNNNYLIIILMVDAKPNPTKIIYTFYTRQAQQIAQQMKDYIVIGKTGRTKHRKSVEFNLRQAPRQMETQPYIK